MGELAKNIEGIGPSRESKLAAAGVNNLDDLRVMKLSSISSETGFPTSMLRTWQQMALLLLIPGIDKQYAEGLVKSSIPDTYALANVDTDIIIQALNDRAQEGLIPGSATEFQVLDWQRYARQIEGGQLEGRKRLTTEVSVVWEAMGCRAARNYYEKMDHSCRWFHQFGPFHAYDVTAEDSLKTPEGYLHAFYVGRRYQIPELLSGCRKAPIMSIGLNPNLRGATDDRRIYPYFDDIRQYAEHFRYRTNYKYSVDKTFYNAHKAANAQYAEFADDEIMPLIKSYVSMYEEYDNILNAFKEGIGMPNADLVLGEDVSYYNFVVCHSPRWDMPSAQEQGIIKECFKTRQFFLRQLRQSNPKAIIIFGKPIMEQFVAFFRDSFDPANIPNPDDAYTTIMANNNYSMKLEGNTIRVIFSSHPTGNRAYYQNIGARDKIVTALKEEYDLGHLTYNSSVKHLDRTEGECEYCNNELFYIGNCQYGK